jgi:hypothetical protein
MIDPTRCMAPRNSKEISGPRCQEPATHSTTLGHRCDLHAEELRRALRNSNTIIAVAKGRAFTEEEINAIVVRLQ